MKKAFERPPHAAIKNHIQELAKIRAAYDLNIAHALEAIQSINQLKANALF